ncbi:MAG TPA: hypothetical protein VJV03_13165 [Pyrinomonadaceae bacterium]|nr:hypothetical protein [Pyrinomonadaceae bacterium]
MADELHTATPNHAPPAPAAASDNAGAAATEGAGAGAGATAGAGAVAGAVINPNQVSGAKTQSGVVDYFPISNRVPIQVFVEESIGQRVGHWGPVFIGFLSFLLAAVIAVNAYFLNQRQIALQEQQNELTRKQNELHAAQSKAQLADMRFKFLNDLTDPDENKKTSAELSLASHGVNALPVIHFALGVEQPDIRDSAVNVVKRMFQAASIAERKEILDALTADFSSPNKLLHAGIVQSLVTIQPMLNADESRLITKVLDERFPPETVCADPEGRSLVKHLARFFPIKDAASLPHLMKIASCPRCGDAWSQAMIRLKSAANILPNEKRHELAIQLDSIEKEAMKDLRTKVTDEDLESGGFQVFYDDSGSGSLAFEDFEKRVAEEFRQLREYLKQK